MELHSYAQLEMIGFFAFVVWLFYYQITSSRKAARQAEEERQERSNESE
ncbi:hypothetical protein [Thiorhodovibrio frisius]|uniref:Uncharacterized protein n=1 Tax=Thiorhodovibrio frisius TaxID=631362 RepID=H8YXA9_9GAMM|nr:hypothetical protein [Thiorhodovibrio frisius]EIC23085.1 hypothetical protein Thi970DRAFT_00737 [Thiorhodovibrio frisius]WPL22651.1 hypothetical protein Thiofri_02818 [Thiorhodovibrio frisius]